MTLSPVFDCVHDELKQAIYNPTNFFTLIFKLENFAVPIGSGG